MALRHQKLVAYEQELIGLVQAIQHWYPYLWTQTFLVRTDHYSLKFLLDQRLAMIPQHRWVSKLLGYTFRVEYRLGRQNIVVDALSRRESEVLTVCALSLNSFHLFQHLCTELLNSIELFQLRDNIEKGTVGSDWNYVDGLITYKGRVYVTASSLALSSILAATHTLGHEGVQKTLHRLCADFFVPKARSVVQQFVQACTIC